MLLSRKTLHKENRGGAHSGKKHHKLWTVVGQFQERLVKQKKAIKSEGDPAGLLVKMHTKPNCIFQPRAFVACHGPCSSLLMLPSTESLITGAKKVQNAYKTVSSLFICILVRFNATDQDKYFTLILPVCISDVLYSPHSKAVPDSECCSSNQSGFSISRVDYLFPFCP